MNDIPRQNIEGMIRAHLCPVRKLETLQIVDFFLTFADAAGKPSADMLISRGDPCNRKLAT